MLQDLPARRELVAVRLHKDRAFRVLSAGTERMDRLEVVEGTAVLASMEDFGAEIELEV